MPPFPDGYRLFPEGDFLSALPTRFSHAQGDQLGPEPDQPWAREMARLSALFHTQRL